MTGLYFSGSMIFVYRGQVSMSAGQSLFEFDLQFIHAELGYVGEVIMNLTARF